MRPNPKIAITALVLVVLPGVFLAGRYERGTAAPPPSPDQRESHPLDREAGITPSPSPPDLASGSDLCPAETLGRITSFISASTTPLIVPGGWVHLKEEVDRDDLDVGTFPDGRPIPEDYVFDHWYLIGADGLAVKSVAVMYDLAGEVIQLSTFDGRTWENPTFGLRYAGEPFPLGLDYGIGTGIRDGRFPGCGYTTGTRSGNPTVEISIWEDFPGGLALVGHPERVSRGTHRAVFDAQTSALLSFEIVFTSQNGRERVVSITTILQVERVDRPPDEMLALLEEYSR